MDTTTAATRAPRAPRARRVVKDAVAAAAVDLARSAAQDVALPGQVGDHLGSAADGERVVVHHFSCTAAGYQGWVWSVTLARAPRAKVATVSEALLLPADGAVTAPVWLPWAQRLRPGDVGRSDVLPRVHDDVRLVAGYESLEAGRSDGADAADDLAGSAGAAGSSDSADSADGDAAMLWELGVGRARVLGPEGRREAATRWYSSERGPLPRGGATSPSCASCGFFVPLSGALRAVFGACANDWSPDDGRVVSRDHGCGAHSETDLVVEPEPLPAPLVDDDALEAVRLAEIEADAPRATAQAGVIGPEDPTL